jgi:hypothetical protein
MSATEIEKRLTAVERRLTHLTETVSAARGSKDINGWIDQIHGTFQNDASYRQAARLGRQWRKSKRPTASRARKAPSK